MRCGLGWKVLTNEARGINSSSRNEQQDCIVVSHKLDREYAVLQASKNQENLLHTKGNNQNSGDNEQCNDGTAAPREQSATKRDSHDSAGNGCSEENAAQVIKPSEALSLWCSGDGVCCWKNDGSSCNTENPNDRVQAVLLVRKSHDM